MADSHIHLETDARGVATITLTRPEVHNAFNDQLVAELDKALAALAADEDVRVVVLAGEGPSFSAGGDLNWMRRMGQTDEAENRDDALALAATLRRLNFHPKPTVARVQGAALGGGVGLACCCDIVVASDAARFGLTEVRLGLVPAVISPYVIDAIGARRARHLFLTGEILDAEASKAAGFVHVLSDADGLDAALEQQIDWLLRGGPRAVAAAKALIFAVQGGKSEAGQQQIDQATASLIARLRVSEEGQEGLTAFLEKRHPSWRS
ncbi:MAG: enoyl-CoA hydratase-related protein [Pseudomonadota bacterium]